MFEVCPGIAPTYLSFPSIFLTQTTCLPFPHQSPPSPFSIISSSILPFSRFHRRYCSSGFFRFILSYTLQTKYYTYNTIREDHNSLTSITKSSRSLIYSPVHSLLLLLPHRTLLRHSRQPIHENRPRYVKRHKRKNDAEIPPRLTPITTHGRQEHIRIT